MSKIFEYNGSQMIDQVTGSALTNNGVEIKRTEKGLAGFFANDSLTLPANPDLSTIDFSFEAYVRTNGLSPSGFSQFIYDQRDSGSDGIRFEITDSDEVTVILNSVTIGPTTTTIKNGKYNHLVFTADRDGNGIVYINGVSSATVDISSAGDINVTTLAKIGTRSFTSNLHSFYGNIKDYTIYNSVLSQTDIRGLYQEFLHTFPLAETKKNFYYAKPTSLNEDGLVASYNMTPSSGKVLTDISNNGNNGTINGTLATTEGMSFDGVNDGVRVTTTGYNASQGSISCCFNIKNTYTTNSMIFTHSTASGGANRIYIWINSSNIIHIGLGDTSTISTGVNADGKHTVTMTWDNGDYFGYVDGVETNQGTYTNLSSIHSFATIGNFFDGLSGFYKDEVIDLKIYDSVKSPQEAKNYHNSFANQVYYRNTFAHDQADGTNILPDGMIAGTGSYKIDTDTDGNNYLECTSSGTIAYQSEQAYGTWEFDFYKGETSNPTISFISSDTSPRTSGDYSIVFTANEEIYFVKDGGTYPFYTAGGYITLNTWYRLKITRTTDGEFTVWIRGGSFGDVYTLVDTTGGSGTNPVTDTTYTESKYTVLDLDAGDRISDIIYRKGVAQS